MLNRNFDKPTLWVTMMHKLTSDAIQFQESNGTLPISNLQYSFQKNNSLIKLIKTSIDNLLIDNYEIKNEPTKYQLDSMMPEATTCQLSTGSRYRYPIFFGRGVRRISFQYYANYPTSGKQIFLI